VNGVPVAALGAALAFLLAALGTPAFRKAALAWGLLDLPNPRSSHQEVVARGGGIPLLLAAGVGLVLAAPPQSVGRAPMVTVVVGLLVIAGVGLWDDRHGLSPWWRLAFHLAAAVAVVGVTGGLDRLPLPSPGDVPIGSAGKALAVLWIVAVINFYNFLDGIDGLAGVQGVVTGTGLALAAWDPAAAALGSVLAGACLGFLVHNWSPARIFLGDVGSGALGFAFAAAPFLAPPASRAPAVLFVALSLWLFLADATWTLVQRVFRGDRWHEAHRQHLYQRLVISGWSHSRVTALIGSGSLCLTLMALEAWRGTQPSWHWLGLGLASTLFGMEMLLARRARKEAR
jgi:glycosyltransferase WbpL